MEYFQKSASSYQLPHDNGDPCKKMFFCFVNWIYLVWSIYTSTWLVNRILSETKAEHNHTCSLSKILANKVWTSPHPPGYLSSSIPPSAPSQQNKTKQMGDPILFCYIEGILVFLGRKTEY